MALYHSDIFIPSDVTLPAGSMLLEYGPHARKEAMSDKYGYIDLPKVINFSDYKVIEVEIIEGKVKKVLYRGSLDSKRDICIVVVPKTRFVKTVWINRKHDSHHSLDTSRYETE